MSTEKSKRSLRNILIYPKFQLALVATQGVILTMAFAIVELENKAAFAKLVKMGHDAGVAPNHAYFRFVSMQSHAFAVHTILAFFVSLVISSAVTFYLSFKLAGPIYRLRNYMRQIADQGAAQVSELTFRNGDFYGDLPEAVNSAVKKLQEDGRKESRLVS